MNALSIEQQVHALAKQHNITSTRTSLDMMAESITRLADDDVLLDNTEMMIIHLGQAGHLSATDVVVWVSAWQDEKRKAKA